MTLDEAGSYLRKQFADLIPTPSRWGAFPLKTDPDTLNIDVFYDGERPARFHATLKRQQIENAQNPTRILDAIVSSFKKNVSSEFQKVT